MIRVHAHPERKEVASEMDMEDRTEKKSIETATQPYGMLMKDSIGMVPPPQTQTVKKTIRRVVENII